MGEARLKKEVLEFLLELINAYPGRTADFYIPIVAGMFGLRDRAVSEYLRLLHLSGDVTVRDGRFYPASEAPNIQKPRRRVLIMVMDYE
jgi:hypothetical protein